MNKSKRSRLALVGISALALSAFAGPGVAQAAKVSEKAGPVTVPDAVGIVDGENTLSFTLKGKNVKKKQTLDVNVILNATAGAPGSLGDIGARLVGPKGDNIELPTPGASSSWVNLKFDSQSRLEPCNPTSNSASYCNYAQGTFPAFTYTGSLGAGLNPVFKGVNPKGTWTLFLADADPDAEPASTVSAELEVKTGKKFAKES